MTSAIYCRVSRDDQNCERQERDLIAYATRAEYEIVGIWKEKGSGARRDRQERKKVLALAQQRKINCVLVTELTRWGRSSSDLIESLHQLASWNVSLVAQTGFQCDLSTPHGRLVAGVLANIAEFERDLLIERVNSGLAAARARGVKLGRQFGQKIVADKIGGEVLALVEQGESYRQIARRCRISKTTVVEIVRHARSKSQT